MRKLQDSFISLLVHVFILFNIERLDFTAKNVINLDTKVYILTIVAIILILAFKVLAGIRQPLLISLAAIVYFALKFTFLSHRPLVGGVYTYLSFTELGMFLVAVYLAQNVALNMKDLEENAALLSLANIRKVKGVREANREIEAEIYRSRRFHRPLSIIVLEQNAEGLQASISHLAQSAQRAMIEQYFSVIIAKELISHLRETDLVLENDKDGKLVILSPDTGPTEAETLMKRLTALTQSAEFAINFGAATFPDHALTFEQLLEHAELDLQQRINGHISADVLKQA